MDRFGDELFSSTGFALDENRAAEAGNRIYQLKDAFHRAASADDVVKAIFCVKLFTQILVFKSEPAFLQTFTDHDRQFDDLERFCKVVVRPFLYGVNSRLNRSVTGDDDADDFRIADK